MHEKRILCLCRLHVETANRLSAGQSHGGCLAIDVGCQVVEGVWCIFAPDGQMTDSVKSASKASQSLLAVAVNVVGLQLGTIVFTQLLIFDSNVPQFGRTICAFTMRLFIFIFLTTARSEDLAGCGIKHCEGITGAGGVLEASEGE